ncbi:beta strand repeat-containing protein [Granulicella cerasi]|uniref:Beta strand repeat-containing protein n=1 Tax=Granulicella cerasi TaxID=741063 RepID=A0ABW1ZAQ3_9BACT|nr:Ig-like domain repeat protein [Granulicella cerasi]
MSYKGNYFSRLKNWARGAMGALALVTSAIAAPVVHAQGLQPGGPIDFGTVAVGATSNTYTITFSATSTTTISSVSAVAEGVAQKDFNVVSQTCTGTINPPQTCTVAISFSPVAAGLRRGAVALTDSSGSVVNRVFLHGIGTGSQVTVSPALSTALSIAASISPSAFYSSGVVTDAAGSLYFSDSQYQRILRRTTDGTVTVLTLLNATTTTQMAIDGAGTLYITAGATVYSLVPGNNPAVFATGGNTLSAASGIAVDAQGYVYIADSTQNKILRVATDGTSSYLSLSGITLSAPSGLAIDANNTLYIADTGNNRVVSVGVYTGTTAVVTTSVTAPHGVAVDAGSNVLVADTGNNRLWMVPSNGTAYALGLSGTSPAQLLQLALALDGTLYAANDGSGILSIERDAGAVNFPTSTRVNNPDNTDNPRTAVLQNSGNVALTLTVPSGGNNWSISNGAFSTDASSTCPVQNAASSAYTLAVGAPCTYAVDFTPSQTGTNSGTGTITVGSSTSTTTTYNVSVALTGTGNTTATKLLVSALPDTIQPGTSTSVTVSAVDDNGNVDQSFIGTVTLSTGDSAATFAPKTYTFTAADAGTHIFTNGVTYNTVGLYTIVGTTGALTGTSNPIRVVWADGFYISATPTSIASGDYVTYMVVPTFRGVAAPKYTGAVTFTSTDSAAKFATTGYTFTAADAGTHTFSGTAGVQLITIGTWTISASDGYGGGTSNNVVVGTPTASAFKIVATPTTINSGDSVSYTVTAVGSSGVTATGFTGTVVFTSSDSAAKFGATSYTFTAADAGVHTFTSGVQLYTAGTQTITGTNGSVTGTSNGVLVNPPAATSFTIVATPTTITSGDSVSYTVTAVGASGASGATATGFTGTVVFTSSDSAAKFGTTSYTFTTADAGVHTFAAGAQLYTTGTQTITGTSGTLTGTSNGVLVNPPTAAAFKIVATPTTIASGDSVSYTVTAVSSTGATATGYTGTVVFTSSDSAAKFGATSYTFTTADAGVHTFTAAVQLYTTGTQTITGTSGTLTGTSNGILVNPPTAASFKIVATPTAITSGDSVSYTVTALGSSGATATGFTGTVAFTSSDSAAKFGVTSYTFTTADAGAHTFTSAVQLYTTGTQTITATSGTLTGTSNGVVVNPPTATAFKIVATPASVNSGDAVSFTITAVSSSGATATGYTGTVALTSSDSAVKFLAGTTYTFTTADAGVHTFTGSAAAQLYTTGTQTISATSGTLTGTSNGVVVNPPTATAFTIVATPTSIASGGAVSFTITAVGSTGTTATGFTGTVALASSDSAVKFLGGTTYVFTAADAGTHTFTGGAAANLYTTGTQTITATSGTLTGTSNGVVVNPPTATAFTIVATPTSITSGGAVSFTITATGANGATATGYTGTIALTSSDSAAKFLGGSSYTFTTADAGVHTFTGSAAADLYTTGTQTITATSGTLTGTSNGVVVNAAPATAFKVTATPTTIDAGQSVSYTISAMNASGSVATGYTGTVVCSSSDAAAKFGVTSYTFTSADNGVHTFTAGATLNTAGTQTITATSGTMVGTSNTVTVNAVATGFTIVATPATIKAGGTVSFTITATGANGATAAGYTGTVAFTSSDTTAKFYGGNSYTFTTADAGVHTFVAPSTGVQLSTLGTQTITATSGTLAGTSNGVLVTSAQTTSTTTMTSSANPTLIGNAVTLTAVVSNAGSGTAVPTGTVIFTDGGATVGSAALSNGTATLSNVLFSTIGTHNLVATYQGDGNYTGSASAQYPELVEDFALNIASGGSSSYSITGGSTATYKLLASPLGGSTFAGAITFTTSGAPTGAKVVTTPASMAAGDAETAFTVAITPPAVKAMAAPSAPRPMSQRLAPLSVAIFGLPLLAFKRRRRMAKLLMLAIFALPLTALTGCLNSTSDGYYGSAPQTYQVVVTGTSGTLTRSVTLTLTVQ